MKKAQKELLKRIGFTDAHIALIEKDEDTFDGDAVFNEVNTAIKTALQADSEFIDPLRQSWQGEVLGSKEKQLLKLAEGKVKQEDIDALPKKDRFMKVVDLVMKAVTPAGDDKRTPDDKDKEIQRLNLEIAGFNTRLTEKDGEINKHKEAVQRVHDDYTIRDYVGKAALAGGRKTVLASDKTTNLLLADLLAAHDIRVKDGKPVLRKKGEDVDVFDPKDRSKPLSIDDEVARIGEANGYFVKNNGGNGGGGDRRSVELPPAQPGKVEPRGMAGARQRQAAKS